MQINDCIVEALGGGDINDLLLQFYHSQGATAEELNDAEYEFLIILGATPANLNDMWRQVYEMEGYTGTLEDMHYQFWCEDQGNLGPTLFTVEWDQELLNLDNMYAASATMTYDPSYEGGTYDMEVTHPDVSTTITRSGSLNTGGTVNEANLDCSVFPDGPMTVSFTLTVGITGPARKDTIPKLISDYVKRTLTTNTTGGVLDGYLDLLPSITHQTVAFVATPNPREFIIGEYPSNLGEYFIAPDEFFTELMADGTAPGVNAGYAYFRNKADNDPLHFVFENVPEGSVAKIVGTPYYLSGELVGADYLVRTNIETDKNAPLVIIFDYQAIPPQGYDFAWDQSNINPGNEIDMSITLAGAEVGADYLFEAYETVDGVKHVSLTGMVTAADQQITGIDCSGIPDGTVRGELTLSNTAGTGPMVVHDITKFTVIPPSDYYFNWDQDIIDRSNQTEISVTVQEAEVGATWSFTAYNILEASIQVTKGGIVTTPTFNITNMDLSGLLDGTVYGDLLLSNDAGAGDVYTDFIAKDTKIYPPSGYDFTWIDSNVNPGNETNVFAQATGVELGATWTFTTTGVGTPVVETGVAAATTVNIYTDLSGLEDGTLTGTLIVDNGSPDGPGDPVSHTIEKDTRLPPSGYDFSWDQESIDYFNQTAITATVTGAEVGADYTFTISGRNAGNIVDIGIVPSSSFQLGPYDCSVFLDGTVTGSLILSNAKGPGDLIEHDITKDAAQPVPSGYVFQWLDTTITPANETAVPSQIASAEVGADYTYTVSGPGSGNIVNQGTVTAVTQSLPDVDCSVFDDGTINGSVILTNSGGSGDPSSEDILKDSMPDHTVAWTADSYPCLEAGNVASITLVVGNLVAGWTYIITPEFTGSTGPAPVTGTTTAGEMTFTFDFTDSDLGPISAVVDITAPGGTVSRRPSNDDNAKVLTWTMTGNVTGLTQYCEGTGDPDWFFPDGSRFRGNEPGARTWAGTAYIGFWNVNGVTGIYAGGLGIGGSTINKSADMPNLIFLNVAEADMSGYQLSQIADHVTNFLIDGTKITGDLSELKNHVGLEGFHAFGCTNLTGTVDDFTFCATTLKTFVIQAINMPVGDLQILINAAWVQRKVFPQAAFYLIQGYETPLRSFDRLSGEGFNFQDGLSTYGNTFSADWNPDSERVYNGDFNQGEVGGYPLHHIAYVLPVPPNAVIWKDGGGVGPNKWQIYKPISSEPNFGARINSIKPQFGVAHYVTAYTSGYFEPGGMMIIQMPDGQRMTITETGQPPQQLINCAVEGDILLISGDPGSYTDFTIDLWSCIQIGGRQATPGVNVFPGYVPPYE